MFTRREFIASTISALALSQSAGLSIAIADPALECSNCRSILVHASICIVCLTPQVFPIGLWVGTPASETSILKTEAWRALREAGVNTVYSGRGFGSPPDDLYFLTRLESPVTSQEYRFNQRHLGYYLKDEPNVQHGDSDIAAIRALVSEFDILARSVQRSDPGKPLWLTLNADRAQAFFRTWAREIRATTTLSSRILVGSDIYPWFIVAVQHPWTSIRDTAFSSLVKQRMDLMLRDFRAEGMRIDRRGFATLVPFSVKQSGFGKSDEDDLSAQHWYDYRPSREDLEVMVYTALLSGAKAIFFFGLDVVIQPGPLSEWSDKGRGLGPDLVQQFTNFLQVIRELRTIAPFLNREPPFEVWFEARGYPAKLVNDRCKGRIYRAGSKALLVLLNVPKILPSYQGSGDVWDDSLDGDDPTRWDFEVNVFARRHGTGPLQALMNVSFLDGSASIADTGLQAIRLRRANVLKLTFNGDQLDDWTGGVSSMQPQSFEFNIPVDTQVELLRAEFRQAIVYLRFATLESDEQSRSQIVHLLRSRNGSSIDIISDIRAAPGSGTTYIDFVDSGGSIYAVLPVGDGTEAALVVHGVKSKSSQVRVHLTVQRL